MGRPKSSVGMVAILLLVGVCAASSLELSRGRMKLVLHEEIGRFSLYYLEDVRNKTYLPLFVDDDPRTSVMSVVVGNKIYRIGESYDFKGKAETTSKGARFVWTSSQLEIVQEFIPITSQASTLEDGIVLRVSLENISGQDLTVGVRVLLDTYLGEDKYVHFRTDSAESMSREITVPKSAMIKYWISPRPDAEAKSGFQCLTSGQDITIPDRIVFANWKRLNENSWAYETSASRNFNNPPYSFNDSAVAHFYDPQKLAKGAKRQIVMILGHSSPEGYSLSPRKENEEIQVLLQRASAGSGEEISDLYYAAQSDVTTLNRLLESIDRVLATEGGVSDDDLAAIEEVLGELKERATGYLTTEE